MADQSLDISPEPNASDSFSEKVHRRVARLRVLARVCSVLGGCLLAGALVACLAVSVVPRVMGLQTYAIISGSMEPAYPTGSVVYAASVDPSSLAEGDVAAFWRGEDVIVHRVQENHGDEGELVTKGDANAENDVRPVSYADVLGKVELGVPVIGYVLMALRSLPGMLAVGWYLLMAVALCVAGSVLGNMARRREG